MTRFGPAGNSERFYEEGHKATVEAPAWVAAQGLNAFEYSAGRGVSLSEATARAIGEEAKAHGVALSLHAPYYINCATPDPEKREKTLGYLLASARACHHLGGERVVFHVGAPVGRPRAEANRRAADTVLEALAQMETLGLGHIRLCPETMGKASQLGSLEEVLDLCLLDERLIPVLDFGHLHARDLGALNTQADFRAVLDKLIAALGTERARHFHAHFSRIAYMDKGEKRHMRFSDPGYGPDFALLAPLLPEYNLEPVIICESNGSQADDAMMMKRQWEKACDQRMEESSHG
jgi:deoxyribonuclease-4